MKNRIKELRDNRGLSLDDLANRVGTTNQQVSHLELGKRRLTADWMDRLANALDCRPWELIEETPPPDLDPRERRILDLFKRVSPAERDALLLLAASLAGEKPG